jgi:hypothetical protein
VQRAAAGALRTLAFKNEENKNQIVECGALPTLIQMLRAEDAGIHYEAVGVIGNLVHSSIHIKRQVRAPARLPRACKSPTRPARGFCLIRLRGRLSSPSLPWQGSLQGQAQQPSSARRRVY